MMFMVVISCIVASSVAYVARRGRVFGWAVVAVLLGIILGEAAAIGIGVAMSANDPELFPVGKRWEARLVPSGT